MIDRQIAVADEGSDGLVEAVARPAIDLPCQVAVRAAADIGIGIAEESAADLKDGAGGEKRVRPGVTGAAGERRQETAAADAEVVVDRHDADADEAVQLEAVGID